MNALEASLEQKTINLRQTEEQEQETTLLSFFLAELMQRKEKELMNLGQQMDILKGDVDFVTISGRQDSIVCAYYFIYTTQQESEK